MHLKPAERPVSAGIGQRLGPVALLVCGARVLATWLAHVLASRRVAESPAVRRWGAAPLISQAGLTLGLGVVIERTFSQFGPGVAFARDRDGRRQRVRGSHPVHAGIGSDG